MGGARAAAARPVPDRIHRQHTQGTPRFSPPGESFQGGSGMKIPLLLLTLLAVTHTALAADPATLRIGYQKGSIALVLAKEHGLLEKRFAHTAVKWVEFPAGPQMLEALNVGALDVGSTGDIPPLFAKAAGADLVYIGAEPPKQSWCATTARCTRLPTSKARKWRSRRAPAPTT